MKRRPIKGRPGYWRGIIGVYGPKEDKLRVFITEEPDGERVWRYKNPGDSHCIFIGPVSKFRSMKRIEEEIRLIELVARIY